LCCVLVRAHCDVLTLAAYNELFSTRFYLTRRQGSARRDCACIDQVISILSYRIAHRPRRIRSWLLRCRYVTLVVPCAWVAVNLRVQDTSLEGHRRIILTIR
jgi:hypothetical protein